MCSSRLLAAFAAFKPARLPDEDRRDANSAKAGRYKNQNLPG